MYAEEKPDKASLLPGKSLGECAVSALSGPECGWVLAKASVWRERKAENMADVERTRRVMKEDGS